MNKMKSIIVASILGLCSAAANAEFVNTDWNTLGDHKAFVNSETGIEWLSLTESWNMSINEVSSQMDEGDLFEGWRLPTRAEVESMTNSVLSEGSVTLWNNLFPLTYSGYHMGLFVNDEVSTRGGSLVMSSGTRSTASAWSYSRSGSLDYKGNAFGVFLVSDGGTTLSSISDPSLNINNANAPVNNGSASVPVSSSVILMGLALAGFGASYRKKKK